MSSEVLIIDNNDSFTYNLAQYIKFLDYKPVIINIDDISNIHCDKYQKIILSPGPGLPDENPKLIDFILKYSDSKDILGVCLGHQAIAMAYGASLYNLNKPRHGIDMRLVNVCDNELLYKDISDIDVGLYHSWAVDAKDLPDCFNVTSSDTESVIMSIRHNKYNLRGVQYHPESIITTKGLKILSNWMDKPRCTQTSII